MYPKKELPFFILFTAGLCSFTALLALLTHQYPESMGVGQVKDKMMSERNSFVFTGDCENHSDVGVCSASLHPREGRLSPSHLAASHVVQDVVLVSNI